MHPMENSGSKARSRANRTPTNRREVEPDPVVSEIAALLPPDALTELDRWGREAGKIVRKHPVASLLVAAGAGFLLGRLFR